MARWTEEQSQAIETEGSNIIVSAGAGSGKTAVLTERVLRKLKNGIDIDSLLILTFTKAAAREMKERIRSSIAKEPTLIKQLDQIDSAYITTFDSFALSVVKKYYYLLKVPMNITVAEASIMSLVKEKYMEEVFEEMYKLGDANFKTFISDFCLKDDKELRGHIINLNEKLSLRYDKDSYLDTYIENYFSEKKIEKDIKDYVLFLKEKITVIQNLVDELRFLTEESYMNKVKDAFSHLFRSETYTEIKNSLIIDFPRLPNGSTDELKKKKEQIVKEMKNLKDLTLYFDEAEIKEEIKSTKPYALSIINIIKRFDKKLEQYKCENDMYEFTDIAKMAICLVDTYPTVQTEMKNRFHEILLDEYQDTSDLQELFISCIASSNVYMVGDIKQSIYRFRNANPYIFKNKYDNYAKNDGGIKIDLMKNFRSRREVLYNINEIFDHVMDDSIGGAEYQNGHQMIFGNMSYEEQGLTTDNHNFEFYTYDRDKESSFKKEEYEIFIVAQDIKKKIESKYKVFDKDKGIIRPVTYNDFVILLDRSKNFTLYKKIFEYLGIPLMIYQDESLRNGYDLDIIKNILKLLVKVKTNTYDTEFTYAFMSIARSYLVNERDEVIFDCITNHTYNDVSFMNTVNELAQEVDLLENHEIMMRILEDFNFYEKIIHLGNVEEALVRFEYLVNLTANLSTLGYDIYDMLTYFENITEHELDIKYSLNTESVSAVKIMTIHKSKGLEYHICYFPGLYEAFNTLEIKERFSYDKNFGLILPVCKNGIKATIYKKMYKEKYVLEEISEKIRLLYVALTRAKEKMIFIGDITDIMCSVDNKEIVDTYTRTHYTSFLDIINSIKSYIEPYIVPLDIGKIGLTKDYNFIKEVNYKQMIDTCNEEIIVKEIEISIDKVDTSKYSKVNKELMTKEKKESMKFGTYLHSVFEMVDFKNPVMDTLPKFYKQKLESFLAQDIFHKKIINIYKEYEFIYEVENEIRHGIIDLILQYENGYAIIDYKTKAIDDIEYEKQLKGYKVYLESIVKCPVDIYIYSILDETLKKL